ncbi:MAG: 16S rRNA (uracil(1498)-N(3))-methyltransferase [Oscillospiraceae bacterium]|nr:16S rRNA (uracil(1498)-N(3))-methyltransferase [Oscillospiraceae bacterium]
MPRFFTSDIADNTVRITGDDARHMSRSLRMRVGEVFEACDLSGFDYRCKVVEISPGLVTASVLQKEPSKGEPAVRISLYQALPKSDKLEQIVQKAVELGVYEITPVLTARCVSRWDSRDAEKKIERLKRIALEASKQSGRGIIPRVLPLCGFEAAIESMRKSKLAVLFFENAKTPLREILGEGYDSISIMTGSEGGFSQEEALYSAAKGVHPARLGQRILRCETAPVCAISAILYAAGEY